MSDTNNNAQIIKPLDRIADKETFRNEIVTLYLFARKRKRLFYSKRKRGIAFRAEFGAQRSIICDKYGLELVWFYYYFHSLGEQYIAEKKHRRH